VVNYSSKLPPAVLEEFIRPAIHAVPSSMAGELGSCHITLRPILSKPGIGSQWRSLKGALEIVAAFAEVEDHDLAMEILLCLGQALWQQLSEDRAKAYITLLAEEMTAGVVGEIDEAACESKLRLLSRRGSGWSRRSLADYAMASFAGTAAEYVHCLWHDVTVRSGPEHLPPERLRRRLKMFARWFPPDRGYRLFPKAKQR